MIEFFENFKYFHQNALYLYQIVDNFLINFYHYIDYTITNINRNYTQNTIHRSIIHWKIKKKETFRSPDRPSRSGFGWG
jgi:hypothetical protein